MIFAFEFVYFNPDPDTSARRARRKNSESVLILRRWSAPLSLVIVASVALSTMCTCENRMLCSETGSWVRCFALTHDYFILRVVCTERQDLPWQTSLIRLTNPMRLKTL